MLKIKTRNVFMGMAETVKKTTSAAGRKRPAFSRANTSPNNNTQSDERSPTEYAVTRVTQASERIVGSGMRLINKKAIDAYRDRKTISIKTKEEFKAITNTMDKSVKSNQKLTRASHKNINILIHPEQSIINNNRATGINTGKASEKSINIGFRTARQAGDSIFRTSKAMEKPAKFIDKSIKPINKIPKTVTNTIKTSAKTIKTTQRTVKTTTRTAQQTAKAIQKTAQAAAKAANAMAQSIRATVRATAIIIKIIAKATVAFAKVIAIALQRLIAAISAGGLIALAIIVIVCLVGLLLGSVFGIFFTGESINGSPTMRAVVITIDNEFNDRIDEIIDTVSHDYVEINGSAASWNDMLAVYAVMANTDTLYDMEVATIDEDKKLLIKDLFWNVNYIDYYTEDVTYTVIYETMDNERNSTFVTISVTETTLYITIDSMTVDEMSELYGFNDNQKKMLAELLRPEYDLLWSSVLHGIENSDIVAVALSQLGNEGGEFFWKWYGFSSHEKWCACFVSWCASECGFIDSGIIPRFSLCTAGAQWFKDNGQWAEPGYEPSAGDIIFFSYDPNRATSHVGIVEKYEDGIIYTVEGNSNDAVRQRSYPVGYDSIYGFGLPAY